MSLTGRSVEVVFSDPWDAATADGATRLTARVVPMDSAAGDTGTVLFMELREPLVTERGEVGLVAGDFRESLGEFLGGESVDTAFKLIVDRQIGPEVLDPMQWRGDLARGTAKLGVPS